MSNAPLMPMATAVWLVENTTLTFKQIANFCNLHEVEIQGIADGEVAKGIMAYNPIISGQLTRDEIELSSKDENRPLEIKNTDIEISGSEKKIKKYVPLSKRQDKPDSALWLIKHHPQLKDSQIAKLVGVTILTSLDNEALNEIGFNKDVKKLVYQQAKLANKAKLDAIVCSAQEVKIVRKVFKKEIITPGIRFDSKLNDQKRVLTPKQAYENGSDWLVIGRPITKGNIKNNIQTLIHHLN